jgi:hypothetical protein
LGGSETFVIVANADAEADAENDGEQGCADDADFDALSVRLATINGSISGGEYAECGCIVSTVVGGR